MRSPTDDVHRDALAVVIEAAGADGDDFALLRLFLGGVRDDEAAGRHFILLERGDDDAVGQGNELGLRAVLVAAFAGAAFVAIGYSLLLEE